MFYWCCAKYKNKRSLQCSTHNSLKGQLYILHQQWWCFDFCMNLKLLWEYKRMIKVFVFYFSLFYFTSQVVPSVDSHHCLWMNRNHQTITALTASESLFVSLWQIRAHYERKYVTFTPDSICQVNVQNWSVGC